METIKAEEVTTLPDRQRIYFNEMKLIDLADSIVENGLLHAIVLHGISSDLVVGERRLRAVQMLYQQKRTFEYDGVQVPEGEIPITRVSSRDAAALYETELVENSQREDLAWQEQAAATAKLFKMRQSQHGKNYTVRDAASEITGEQAEGCMITKTREQIVIADYLDDEDVASAKTRKEAVKIVERKLNRKKNENLASRFKESQDDSRYTLIHGDAMEGLQTLGDNSIDVFCSDPPYGIGADTFGDQTFIDHEYDDSEATWKLLMHTFAEISYIKAKIQAHGYIFCDIRRFESLRQMFDAAGWYTWNTPFIWDKGNIGTLPRPEHGPRRCYETILYIIKGDKKVQQVGQHDILRVPATKKPRHAAEKPVDLYTDLLKRSARPGDILCDPFAGSGTIFPAAHSLQCKAIGIELVEENIGICQGRIEELQDGE